MNPTEESIDRYLRFVTDTTRNISNIIHLTNNLRYNTFQIFNNYTNTNLLTNDIFFPPEIFPRPPLNPPPQTRRINPRRRTITTRRVSRNGRMNPPNLVSNLFNFTPTENNIAAATESFRFL